MPEETRLIKTEFLNKKAHLQPEKPELHKCAVWPTVLGYVKKNRRPD
jgi:hypothetical protein